MSDASKWSDLLTRLGSAALMVVVGFIGIWFGGHLFHVLVAVVCGLMIWELVRMIAPRNAPRALQLGVLGGCAVFLSSYVPTMIVWPIFAAVALVGYGYLNRYKGIYVASSILILLASFNMVLLRDSWGFGWLLWLIAVVVITDVLGYFAGRLIGGPKFWPAVSPKKTWSGTVFGWLGGALVGLGFAWGTGLTLELVLISILISMASQMGDVAESAIKRKMNVKDSSNLIPGHGGLLDRFDGMLGASVFLFILAQFISLPFGLT